MKILFKRFIALCILIIMIFNLSGCYDATGIEELAYVVALGLDTTDSGDIELTLQIATEGSDSGQDSSSSSTQSKQTNTTTVKCKRINSGLAIINNHISKKANLSHCQVIVISEDLAKQGISEYIDTLLNNVELRNDCSIIISKCDAKEYINNVKPSLETLVARFYESTLNSAKYTGFTVNVSLSEFYSKMRDTTCEPYAILGALTSEDHENDTPKLNANNTAGEHPITDEDVIDNFGIAVFKDDTFVGELTGLDSICYVILSNELDECTLSVPNPFEDDKYLDLNLTAERKTSCKITLNDDSPYIDLTVYLDGRGLSLDKQIQYDNEDSLKRIEDSASQYIKDQINTFLYKTSKEYNSDLCGFGKYAVSKYRTIPEWNNSQWLNNYKNATFNVNVHLNVESGSLFIKS